MMMGQGASSLDPSKRLQLPAQQQNATLSVFQLACFVLLLSQLTNCFRHYYTSR